MAVKSTPVQVRASTLVAMAVMDALDAGLHSGSIMLHGISTVERERLITGLVAAGWRRNDGPENRDMRGARDPQSGCYIAMWAPESESRCPECGGSGVSSVEPGERCIVCKGQG